MLHSLASSKRSKTPQDPQKEKGEQERKRGRDPTIVLLLFST
jgi:hypothetical protein